MIGPYYIVVMRDMETKETRLGGFLTADLDAADLKARSLSTRYKTAAWVVEVPIPAGVLLEEARVSLPKLSLVKP